MADQRITELTQLNEADVAATDVLPIVDLSATQTKKVTVKDLFEAGATVADSSSIDLGKLNQSSATKLGSTSLGSASVTAAKLAANSSIVYSSTTPTTDNFTGRGYVNSTTKALSVYDGSAYQAVNSSVGDDTVTTSKIAANAVTDAKIQAGGLSGSSIANSSITIGKLNLADNSLNASKLVNNSVTATQLANDSVITARIQDDAVTTAKIADDAVTADQLATGSVTSDALAANSVTTTAISANQVTYAKIQQTSGTDVILGRSTAGAGNVEEITCTAAGRALLDDVDIAAQRTTLGLGTLATASGTWTNGSTFSGTSSGVNTGDQTITLTGDVTGTGTGTFSTTIASDAVTTAKILNSNVTTAKIADDAITSAKLADDSATVISGNAPNTNGEFEGQQWINSNTGLNYYWTGSVWVQVSALQTISFTDNTPLNFAVTKPDNYTAVVTATLDNQNANLVLAGPTSGAATTPSFRALTSGDLPIATSSDPGAVRPGTGLAVTGAGVLNHSNVVAAGSYARVTVDAQGHVTSGGALIADDIPSLDASKLTSGTLASTLFGTNSVLGAKLANESTVRFGGAGSTAGVVTFPVAEFKGQYFWDELNGDLYIWSGSAWLPVTITSGEIVFAGTYDAAVNEVDSVTTAGTAVGLTIGGALPAATSTNNRYYVVVSQAGTGSGTAPAEALSPPDMLLSNGTTWELIDVSGAIAGQTATNISFTPYGNIISTNVQAAIQELDNEKLGVAGGTLTGSLTVGTGGSFFFEGSTADAYETQLTCVDPTADRTITFPNATGTVVLSGAIVNADIDASAAIVDTKLATISTANKVSLSAIDIDGATDLGTALTDADIFIVDDDGAGTNRKAAVTRISDYVFGKVSGDITIASNGTATIGSGVIVDADISASAEIAVSKLADGTARQLLQTDTAGTGVEWTSNVDIPGTLDVTGAAVFDSTVGVVGAFTFNDAGGDVDLRMEGDTNTHLFFLDASVDRIGINQSAPASKLDLSGNYASNITAVSALDIDCSTGNYFTKTINGNSTFTFSNPPASRAFSFTLELTHTSGTPTWPAAVKWNGDTPPTLNTGKTHLLMFFTDDGGTRWRGAALANYVD